MVRFKLFESRLAIVERALYIASRMVGTERSRGYCLELVCADFLAGCTDESTPEEVLLVIERSLTFCRLNISTGLALFKLRSSKVFQSAEKD